MHFYDVTTFDIGRSRFVSIRNRCFDFNTLLTAGRCWDFAFDCAALVVVHNVSHRIDLWLKRMERKEKLV